MAWYDALTDLALKFWKQLQREKQERSEQNAAKRAKVLADAHAVQRDARRINLQAEALLADLREEDERTTEMLQQLEDWEQSQLKK